MIKNFFVTAVIAISATTAAAEGCYGGAGLASVKAKEGIYSYGSTNTMLLFGCDFNDFFALEGETSWMLKKDKVTIASTSVYLGITHSAAFAKFTMPTSSELKPYVRLGMSKAKASATVGATTVSTDDTAFAWGVGAEFNYDESTGIRLDYSTSSYAGSTDGTVMSLTVVFRE